MRLVVILTLLSWFILTAAPAVALFRGGQRRVLALAGLASSLVTVLLGLLLVIEWLPFFGDAWHNASVWLHLSIGLAALNFALGFSCLLFAAAPRPVSARGARSFSIDCIWLAMVIVAAAGANDRFLYTMKFNAPLVSLTACLLILAFVGALLSGRTTRR